MIPDVSRCYTVYMLLYILLIIGWVGLCREFAEQIGPCIRAFLSVHVSSPSNVRVLCLVVLCCAALCRWVADVLSSEEGAQAGALPLGILAMTLRLHHQGPMATGIPPFGTDTWQVEDGPPGLKPLRQGDPEVAQACWLVRLLPPLNALISTQRRKRARTGTARGHNNFSFSRIMATQRTRGLILSMTLI
jgi:hypothetical protein